MQNEQCDVSGGVFTDQFIFQLQNQIDRLHLRVLLDSLLQVLQTDRQVVRGAG